MAIVPAAPPVRVPVFSGFDYVTVDADRRRVYAAHTGSRALLIVDADSGAVAGQVRVGPMHGVAVDPASGHVYTGNGDDKSVSEVDPQMQKVVRSVDVPGVVDAIAFDAATGRIYADEDDGTRVFVIDARTFKAVAVITLPGHKPEYLAVDPQSHDVYQNIADIAELAIIDAASLTVKKRVKTAELANNHPLVYDPDLGQVVVAGTNGAMSVYDRAGTRKYTISGVKRFDQCDLDRGTHVVACAGDGAIALYRLSGSGPPVFAGEITVAPGVHTLAVDPKTHAVWAVWSARDGGGDYIQRFTLQP